MKLQENIIRLRKGSGDSNKNVKKSNWEEINELVSKPKKNPVINETKINQKINLKPSISQTSTVDSFQTALELPVHNISGNTIASNETGSSKTTNGSQIDRISERDPDGTRRIRFLNTGVVKTVEPNGIVTVKFSNGDVKTCYPEGLENDLKKDVYFYNDTRTTETTFYEKSVKHKVINFDDGQTEHYYRDGKKEIVFGDRSRRTIWKV